MNTYELVVSHIIKEQEAVVGPLALDQAKKVAGIEITSVGDVKLVGNGKEIVAKLVSQYEKLFGLASVEVCKDAIKEVKPTVPPEDLPDILK